MTAAPLRRHYPIAATATELLDQRGDLALRGSHQLVGDLRFDAAHEIAVAVFFFGRLPGNRFKPGLETDDGVHRRRPTAEIDEETDGVFLCEIETVRLHPPQHIPIRVG